MFKRTCMSPLQCDSHTDRQTPDKSLLPADALYMKCDRQTDGDPRSYCDFKGHKPLPLYIHKIFMIRQYVTEKLRTIALCRSTPYMASFFVLSKKWSSASSGVCPLKGTTSILWISAILQQVWSLIWGQIEVQTSLSW